MHAGKSFCHVGSNKAVLDIKLPIPVLVFQKLGVGENETHHPVRMALAKLNAAAQIASAGSSKAAVQPCHDFFMLHPVEIMIIIQI